MENVWHTDLANAAQLALSENMTGRLKLSKGFKMSDMLLYTFSLSQCSKPRAACVRVSKEVPTTCLPL